MRWSDQQLMAYFEESLAGELMSAIEDQLRSDAELRERLIAVVGMRDAGVHGLGDIWRRHRLSCPSRQQLGSFLLGAIDAETQDYIQFHLDQAGCRFCQANLEDLREQQRATHADAARAQSTAQRRRKYFQTSAGYLRKSP
jgi:hypothetical protein